MGRLFGGRGQAFGFAILVGRCEAYLTQTLDLDEVIRRLMAYGVAGADCLYAPRLRTLESVARVVAAVDKPVNASLTATGLSVDDMAAVGVGAALAAAIYMAFDGFVARLSGEGRLP